MRVATRGRHASRMAFVVRGASEPQRPPATAATAGQQPPPPQTRRPTRSSRSSATGINFVRVDVIVTDRQGNPVADLKQTDFEVLEDGKPQAIETFRLVKIDTARRRPTRQRAIRTRDDEETAAADEDARIFVFFLDDYHVRLGNSMAVAQAAGRVHCRTSSARTISSR